MIQTGDLLFTRGRSILARLIQLIDKCRFNHIGIIAHTDDGTPLVIESLAKGISITYLEERIRVNEDFVIYRLANTDPQERIEALSALHQGASLGKAGKTYDIPLLLKIGLARLLNIFTFAKHWFKQDNKSGNDICSETARRYTDLLNIDRFSRQTMLEFTGREWITPNDFLKYGSDILIKIKTKNENQ